MATKPDAFVFPLHTKLALKSRRSMDDDYRTNDPLHAILNDARLQYKSMNRERDMDKSMGSSLMLMKIKDEIEEDDKKTILDKCHETAKPLYANQLTGVEEFNDYGHTILKGELHDPVQDVTPIHQFHIHMFKNGV